MKRKYRKRALDELLSQLNDRNFDVREFALFQLALILERSNPQIDHAAMTDYHGENLTRDLLRLRLSPEEQTAVGARLAQVAAYNRQSRSSSIWTLAKLNGATGVPILVGIVLSAGEDFDNESAVQACDALRNWLNQSEEDCDGLHDSEALPTLLRMLRQWEKRDNDQLRRRSAQVIDLLEHLGHEPPGESDQ